MLLGYICRSPGCVWPLGCCLDLPVSSPIPSGASYGLAWFVTPWASMLGSAIRSSFKSSKRGLDYEELHNEELRLWFYCPWVFCGAPCHPKTDFVFCEVTEMGEVWSGERKEQGGGGEKEEARAAPPPAPPKPDRSSLARLVIPALFLHFYIFRLRGWGVGGKFTFPLFVTARSGQRSRAGEGFECIP